MELKLSTTKYNAVPPQKIEIDPIEKQLMEIRELTLNTDKSIKYIYNKDSNTFHLDYYKDKYFSINNFDFGYLEFKKFLINLIK